MNAIHAATIPPDLDLKVLDAVLGALEVALLQVGAERVWIADGPALAVMAELPDDPAPKSAANPSTKTKEHAKC